MPAAITVSRATRSTIRLILAISLPYNAVRLLLAATGWLHPIAAAAIMFASSLTVVALRGACVSSRASSHRDRFWALAEGQ